MKEKIQKTINEDINPMLAQHHGSVSIDKIEVKEASYRVYLTFEGLCQGSPSAFTGTLKMIEFHLREELNLPGLTVINSEGMQWE